MKLMTKAKLSFGVLAVVGALGFYYLNPGTKLDTSKDKQATFNMEYDPAVRAYPIFVRIFVNGREALVDEKAKTPWTYTMWARPGEKLSLRVVQQDFGHVACAISIDGVLFGPEEVGPGAGSVCLIHASA